MTQGCFSSVTPTISTSCSRHKSGKRPGSSLKSGGTANSESSNVPPPLAPFRQPKSWGEATTFVTTEFSFVHFANSYHLNSKLLYSHRVTFQV